MTVLTLPDIAAQAILKPLPLNWVGMSNIAIPVSFAGKTLRASANAGVSLDDGSSRGIHMSRLYLSLEIFEQQPLTPLLFRQVLDEFLQSHAGLSGSAFLNLRFDLMLKRPALVSPLAGWKAYPITLNAQLKDELFHVELKVEVDYSSTCPCSAALARQLIQRQFLSDFSHRGLSHEGVFDWLGSAEGIVATPHSQRSVADVQVRLEQTAVELPIVQLLDQVEGALGTAVQTAVKRADEQAFALANGQNLMFCEDAARRLHLALQPLSWLSGFAVRVEHAESLHAHNAVACSQWQW